MVVLIVNGVVMIVDRIVIINDLVIIGKVLNDLVFGFYFVLNKKFVNLMLLIKNVDSFFWVIKIKIIVIMKMIRVSERKVIFLLNFFNWEFFEGDVNFLVNFWFFIIFFRIKMFYLDVIKFYFGVILFLVFLIIFMLLIEIYFICCMILFWILLFFM